MRYVFVVNMQTLAENSQDQYFTLCKVANILMSLYSLTLWPTNSSSYHKHRLPITVAKGHIVQCLEYVTKGHIVMHTILF